MVIISIVGGIFIIATIITVIIIFAEMDEKKQLIEEAKDLMYGINNSIRYRDQKLAILEEMILKNHVPKYKIGDNVFISVKDFKYSVACKDVHIADRNKGNKIIPVKIVAVNINEEGGFYYTCREEEDDSVFIHNWCSESGIFKTKKEGIESLKN